MNTTRTLYIHAGAPKTGSSALQVFLHKNRSILKQKSVAYEFSPEVDDARGIADNISGNGSRLVQASMSLDSNLRQIIEDYFAGFQTALISSELLYNLSVESLQRLADCCFRAGINPSIIVFVRNIGHSLWSSYHQLVKNHLADYSFEEYIARTDRPPHAEYIERLTAAFPRNNIRVLHYDSQKNALDLALLQCLGLEPAEFDRSFLMETINRSLNEFELHLMLKINSVLSNQGLKNRIGENLTSSLSAALRARNPELPSARLASQSATRLIADKYRDDVDWMNKSFFAGREVVLLFDSKEKTDESTYVSDTLKLDILDAALSWAIAKLAECHKEYGGALVSEYVGAAQMKAATCARPETGLPDEFDPFYYLMANLDILKADDPYRHYLSYGREEGRAYTWRKR